MLCAHTGLRFADPGRPIVVVRVPFEENTRMVLGAMLPMLTTGSAKSGLPLTQANHPSGPQSHELSVGPSARNLVAPPATSRMKSESARTNARALPSGDHATDLTGGPPAGMTWRGAPPSAGATT